MKNNESFFLYNYCHSMYNVVDCQIMHLRDICATLGLPISGEMCFGIGEGYSFEYWLDRSSKIPCLIMLGRSLDLNSKFMDKVGLKYKFDTVTTELDFEKYVEEKITLNHLPLVYADRYHLKYLEKKFNRAHFGNHIFSVVGIKKENNEVSYALNDVTSEDLIWCSAEEIQMARSSIWKPFSPDCKVIDIDLNNNDFENIREKFSELIKESINKTANFMLTEPKGGVNAMSALASEIGGLLETDLKKLSRALAFQMRLLASFIREFEETQSFYRMTYSTFLEESANKYGLTYLYPFSLRMKDIAKQWIQMSQLINSDKPLEELLKEFSNRLKSASDLERVFFEELKQIIQ